MDQSAHKGFYAYTDILLRSTAVPTNKRAKERQENIAGIHVHEA